MIVILLLTLLHSINGELFHHFGNKNCTRYGFYREIAKKVSASPNTRRLFGGTLAMLETYPSTCALLDRYMNAVCTGAVVREYWVLTAAHCVTPWLAYVRFNTRRIHHNSGELTSVAFRYRHPNYKVVEQDEGRGKDVVTLNHDVGLIRTTTPMHLASARVAQITKGSPWDPVSNFQRYSPEDFADHDVEVFGFGRTGSSVTGEELFSVQLTVSRCSRHGWDPCMCGKGTGAGRSQGVCTGDSGGPVIYRNVQVGVTSMGPMDCAEGQYPPQGALSVFTLIHPYSDIINATVEDVDSAVRMEIIRNCSPQLHDCFDSYILIIIVPIYEILLVISKLK